MCRVLCRGKITMLFSKVFVSRWTMMGLYQMHFLPRSRRV